MSSNLDPSNTSPDTRLDERKQSPPAFLDLADSAARLGTNMPDISGRGERKRMEQERQRIFQRKIFEDQFRALEQQEMQDLLNIPLDGSSGNSLQHLAVSAPTTPPRVSAMFPNEYSHENLAVDAHILSRAVSKSDNRKSVTYAPTISSSTSQTFSDFSDGTTQSSFNRAAGAKSMPASRRASDSSHEDLADHMQNLAMNDIHSSPVSMAPPQQIPTIKNGRFYDDNDRSYGGGMYNAGLMLDEQLDKEMQNAMRNLAMGEDERYVGARTDMLSGKLSTSSAALDLANAPRGHLLQKNNSEWPTVPRGPEGLPSRNDRRTVTTPQLGISPVLGDLSTKLSGTVSASGTPHIQQRTPGISRRASPLDMQSARQDFSLGKRSTGPAESQHMSNGKDLSGMHRASPSQIDRSPLSFGSIQNNLTEPLAQQYEVESIYGMNNEPSGSPFMGYGFESNPQSARGSPGSTAAGSTALYHHHGSRFGLGLGGRPNNASDNKMNGLHGPKHKRGDIDREFNRFAGTRLEDLQGEIAGLCKDQHGCRYLQKKLEEGVPEHRDIIFRETFKHFAELMTDPFGNYLCQKLLEYSTDDQRNLICESVAQDLVNISLNMHGTRAVQKMIDFLSTKRQADLRYNTQIRSIIVALSLHVVVLIKDLNGNHVIQKCLNKLAPEDNQFIYNAVAANCVEVATHRHGCCVLQRCIDHASEQQRVQLVNEITYNALTLVQDPYGNYVVQYILDLNDNRFSDAVIRQFTGNVCALSVQKFSSNVIEKCIRVAEHNTRKMLIEELLNRTRLEKLLRDSFGNYCVQTALDYADPAQRALLVDGIRPILPLIRNTPYGKRIQSKLQREQVEMVNASGPYVGFQQQQQALVNMALNQGLAAQGRNVHNVANNRHVQQGMHANQMASAYRGRPVYGMPQANLAMPAQQALHLHGGQLPLSMQSHPIDGYILQNASNHGHGSGANGFTNGFSAAAMSNMASYGTAVGLNGNVNDPYQRATYAYGM